MQINKQLIIAFSAGFILMVLELSASRVFAPFFGSSLTVWTAIIGIFMAAMALGYYWGGILARKKQFDNIRLAFVIILLFSLAIPFFSPFILTFLKNTGVHIGSILSVIIIFGLPAFFISNISPLLIQQVNEKEKAAGFSAGEVYAVSTVGSIIGTFAVGFLLLPYLGITGTMFFIAAVCLILAFLAGGIPPLVFPVAFIFTLLSLVTTFWGIPTEYYSVNIAEEGGVKYMFLDNQRASALNQSNFSSPIFNYAVKMKELMDTHPAEKATLIGAGGCTQIHHLRDSHPDTHLYVVDIDSKLFDICKEEFYVPIENIDFVTMDGRIFLEENKGFDLVIVDVYSTTCSPPIHFTSVEFFSILGESLNPDGIAMMNVIIPNPTNEPFLIEKLERTLESAGFKTIEIYPSTPTNWSLQNYVILLSNYSGQTNHQDNIFTDDKNDFMNFYLIYC